MRVLVVSTNRYRRPIPVIPYGACLVAEAAEKAGHQVQFLDFMFDSHPGRSLEESLARMDPEIVGLSVRNIDNNDIFHPLQFAGELKSWMEIMRRRSKAPVVLGGAALSIMAGQLLQTTGADWAVTRDGDLVFPRLLDTIAKGDDPSKLPGVVGRDLRETDRNHRPMSPVASRTLAPDYRKWIDWKAYEARFSPVPLKTQWGCPFDCIYCTYPLTEGREYRLARANQVVCAVKELASHGILDIEFVDNVFNSPYEHAVDICRALIEANPKRRIRFHTVELNPALLDDPLLGDMEAAGFRGIGITAESAVDSVLERLGKHFRAREVEQAASLVSRHKIPCFWVFLLGGPGETKETILETLDFARKRIRPSDPVFFNVGLRIYPGTRLEPIAREEQVLEISADQMLKPVFYFSSHLDPDWLQDTLLTAARRHPNFMTPQDFALPSLDGIFRLAHWMGFQPPIWQYTRRIRQGLNLMRAS